VSLLDAAALAALVFAIPLIALHFRRRRPPRREVGSLLAWKDLPRVGGGAARRFGRPPLPLLLLLQLLALVLLVFALAHPVGDKSTTDSSRVYVVDESMWMGATEGSGTRIDTAGAELRERLAEAPGDEAVRIVGAGATPTVLYEGEASGAGGALSRLRAGPGAANLPAALRLAAGLRAGSASEVVLLRAPEEAAPKVRGGEGSYEDVAVGKEVADVGLSGASAHCDRLGIEACEVFVRLTDRGGTARRVPLRIAISGEPTHKVSVEGAGERQRAAGLHHQPGDHRPDQPLAGRRARRRRLGLRLGPPAGRRADHPGRRSTSRPAARPRARLGPRGEAAAAHPGDLRADRPGHQRPARARRLRPQGRPPRRARRAPGQPAPVPRRPAAGGDEGQPDERHRSGEPAARRGRPRLADDRLGSLAPARPARGDDRRRLELGRAADRLRHRVGAARRGDVLRALRIQSAAALRLPRPDRQHRRLVAASGPANRRRGHPVRARRA